MKNKIISLLLSVSATLLAVSCKKTTAPAQEDYVEILKQKEKVLDDGSCEYYIEVKQIKDGEQFIYEFTTKDKTCEEAKAEALRGVENLRGNHSNN